MKKNRRQEQIYFYMGDHMCADIALWRVSIPFIGLGGKY